MTKSANAVADTEILELIAADPEAGISRAIATCGSQLLGRFHAYTRDRGYGNADVEDVWQDAMLRLLDPLERAAIAAHGGSILAWLTRWGYWRLRDRRSTAIPLNE